MLRFRIVLLVMVVRVVIPMLFGRTLRTALRMMV